MQLQMQTLLQSRIRQDRPLILSLLVTLSLLIAFLVQAWINQIVDRQLVFCLIPPVIIIAWYSGFVPALIATLIAVAGADFFLFEPYFAFDIKNTQDLVTLAAYSAIVIPGAWVFAKLSIKTSQLSLAQSELEMTLKSIGDAVLVVDRESKVAFLNPIAERLTGWSLNEARGRALEDVFQIINESTRRQAINPVGQVLREGAIVGLANHTVLISKDGQEFQIEDSAAPIRAHNNEEVAGVVLVFRDVTTKYASEKRATETLEKLEAVIAELGEGIVFADSFGSNVRMNKAALKMHGFKSASDMFEHFEKYKDVFRLETLDGKIIRHEDWPLSKVLRGERFQDYEVTVIRNDNGHAFTASYGGTPIFDKDRKVRLAVINVRDISSRAAAEAELKRAKDEAEQASNLKTSFLANMSHEIRTPMTAVLGFAEVLKSGGLSDEEQEDALERIERSGRALLKLLDDILDVSKVEAGKIEIQKTRFSPIEITSEVISLLRIQADKKGIDLRLKLPKDFPEIAYSDPMRVRQILTNLIGNALKFTNDGYVEICLHIEGEYLVFEIADTGIGISESDRKKLFQPFAQADGSITRRFGGTGLGLILSREIAQALGGSLELVKSESQKGSQFEVRIPAAPFEKIIDFSGEEKNELLNTQSTKQNQPDLSGLKILLAEDVVDNQKLVSLYLTSAGVSEIQIAKNGNEAVSKALNKEFDLILMDIQMPEMDGLQATQKLRKAGYKKPIIALTAHAMFEEVDKTLKAGCNGHLAKPISKETLVETIIQFTHKI